MRPIKLSTGRVVPFMWSERDHAYIATDNGTGWTDAEWNEFNRIIDASARRAA